MAYTSLIVNKTRECTEIGRVVNGKARDRHFCGEGTPSDEIGEYRECSESGFRTSPPTFLIAKRTMHAILEMSR